MREAILSLLLDMKKVSLGETNILKTSQLEVAKLGFEPEPYHCVHQRDQFYF